MSQEELANLIFDFVDEECSLQFVNFYRIVYYCQDRFPFIQLKDIRRAIDSLARERVVFRRNGLVVSSNFYYDEGYKAFNENRLLLHNPYGAKGWKFEQWQMGWEDAAEDRGT